MTYLKNTTQKAERMIFSYYFYKGKNKGKNLSEIYGRYSWKKEKALQYCKTLKAKKRGSGACFGGHNSDYFSYMFTYKQNGKKYLAYITYANDYAVEIEGA